MIIRSVLQSFKCRVLLAFIFIAIAGPRSFSQTSRPVDSLLSSLSAAKEDKRKVSILNALSRILWQQSQYEESKKYATEALTLSEKLEFRQGMANAYHSIGEVCRLQGNYSEALKNYMSSVKIWEEVGNRKGIGFLYTSMGIIYSHQDNHPEALKYYLAALAIGKENKDRPGMAGSYNHVGLAYSREGKYKEALEHHQASLKIWKELGNKRGVALSHSNIGVIQMKEHNPEEALENFQISLKIAEEIGDKRIIAVCYNNMGRIYTLLNRITEAKQYLANGLKLSRELGLKENIKEAYHGLSRLDSITGDYRLALVNYQFYTEYKDSLLNESNNKLIAQMREQYESEKKDKEILQLVGDKQKLESEKQFSTLLLKTKHDSLIIAQAENERMQTLSLFNRQQLEMLENEKKLQQLQIEKDNAEYAMHKAESDKKQEQLVLLSKEKAIQTLELKKQKQAKNYFIGGLFLAVALSFFIYRNYHTRQKLKLLTLRNKIASDLHDDIGSTLSSISIFSQMAPERSGEIKPMLQTLGESSRKMLDAMADIVWTINPENDQFEKIILRMRSFAYELLGARQINFRFVADDSIAHIKLSMETRKNLYLIFKEATNNMAKYAGASQAMFSIKGEKDKLVMLIKDNGKGFDSFRETSGNGLKNMKKRATDIGGNLLIDSIPGTGTTIKLELAV